VAADATGVVQEEAEEEAEEEEEVPPLEPTLEAARTLVVGLGARGQRVLEQLAEQRTTHTTSTLMLVSTDQKVCTLSAA